MLSLMKCLTFCCCLSAQDETLATQNPVHHTPHDDASIVKVTDDLYAITIICNEEEHHLMYSNEAIEVGVEAFFTLVQTHLKQEQHDAAIKHITQQYLQSESVIERSLGTAIKDRYVQKAREEILEQFNVQSTLFPDTID